MSSPDSSPVQRTSWRDVTPAGYRRANLLSVPLGVFLLAAGMWDLAHANLARGLVLVVVGFGLGVWTAALRIEGMPAAIYRPGMTREGLIEEARSRGKRRGAEPWAPRVIHFYTRHNCLLCDEAKARMLADLDGAPVTIVDHDVGEDSALEKLYGHEVPVAIYDGQTLFALAYDPDAVRAVAKQVAEEAA